MKSIIRSIKHILLNIYDSIFARKNFQNNSLDNAVLVMLAADYNNLGDVAITYAQKNFLQNVFKDKNIIEIPVKDTVKFFIDMKKKVTSNTLITIIGGGNTGDRYELIERYRRFIIRNFKNNKVIIFPQTIDFSDTKYGTYSLKRSIKDYSRNKNMIICARESKSEEIYKKLFSNKVILTPDIVFSLECDNNFKREGMSLMLRDDGEKILKNDDETKLIKKLSKIYGNVLISDTCIKNFEYENRYELLFKKIDEIASKKFVITDRLHGMIFCYITKTPCIVMPNNNHKILMTYENWLKDCNYIKLIRKFSLDEIIKNIEILNSLDEFFFSKTINEKQENLKILLRQFNDNEM
ncbi:hypothetical protein D2A30_07305 [Streptococcus suis]|nr:polysaccharide pyruvyl transferase family protein [Streptococcus suis]QCO71536.1 putative pyruvyl transferase [Streptococcus suis]ULL21390.1 hypothetical protein D2A30_07305 [Streptococcus suis]